MTDSTTRDAAEIVNLEDVMNQRTFRKMFSADWIPPTCADWDSLPQLITIAHRLAVLDGADLGEESADLALIADMMKQAVERFRFIAHVAEIAASRLLA